MNGRTLAIEVFSSAISSNRSARFRRIGEDFQPLTEGLLNHGTPFNVPYMFLQSYCQMQSLQGPLRPRGDGGA